MHRKKNSGCLILILLILGLGAWRLWTAFAPAAGTYPAADAAIEAFCEEYDLRLSDYPEELRQLLERNPETEEFVLHYPLNQDKAVSVDLSGLPRDGDVPLFLQWDTRWGHMEYGGKCAALTACGPMCLSMAAWYLTGDEQFSPDRMIDFADREGYYVPGSGSSWTLISEGGETLGFQVTELPLVKSRIFKHLEQGDPVICAMGPGDFTTSGHFILLTGVEDGLLRVNDPNSREKSGKLWSFEDIESQFRNLWVIEK